MTKIQMKNISKALLRGACVAAFVLAVAPGTAQAQFIDFQVVEGVVPGTDPNTFTADLINGLYSANLTLVNTSGTAAPNDGNGGGTWTETSTATFSQYSLDDVALVGPFIGDAETNGYTILGTLTASGNYTEASNCSATTFECIGFEFLSQTGTLGIDADQDGIVDIPLMTATGVAAGTFGQILFSGGITGGAGNFISNFLSASLAAGLADDYWPTLGNLSFTTTISGDINQLSLPNIVGDVSVQFVERVPEPATLTLLGLGLAGVAGMARRRRAAKK